MKQLPIRPPAPAPESLPRTTSLGEIVAELFGGSILPPRKDTYPGEAECLLRDLFLGADLIGYGGPHVHLLVTVDRPTFAALCQHGAAREDAEDGGDTEPTLGSVEGKGVSQRDWSAGGFVGMDAGEDEASLGSTGMLDQHRWNEGEGDDLEAAVDDRGEPDVDAEPDGDEGDYSSYSGHDDAAIIDQARARFQAKAEIPADHPVTLEHGKWVIFGKGDGR